jgi:hypothetical protein
MGSGGIAPPFLTSALNGGDWSDSLPGHFIPSEKASDTLYTGSWVGPIEEEYLALREIEPGFFGRPINSLVSILTELSC